jgi:hypothetical protein
VNDAGSPVYFCEVVSLRIPIPILSQRVHPAHRFRKICHIEVEPFCSFDPWHSESIR